MKNKRFIFLLFMVILFISGSALIAFGEDSGSNQEKSIKNQNANSNFGKYIGAGLAIACATIGSGIAVGKIGSAAMGAISEKPETTGISLVFVALAEGISLWGFLVAFLILNSK
ncbi:MAG TPA: ATP synthase subunit C [Spirochaetota bacterium]|nr:ATP synthase subunit C [Spirochaetota bacterium]